MQSQLHEEPLWFNLDRKPKDYSLNLQASSKNANQQRRVEQIFVDETDRLLLTRLNEMKIADNEESGDSADDADEDVSFSIFI